MAGFRVAPVCLGRARWDAAVTLQSTRLTRRQQMVVDAFSAHVTAHGYPPSGRWIAGQVGLSPSAAAYQLRRLQSKGVLVRDGRLVRGVRLSHRVTRRENTLQLIPGRTP